MKYLIASDIHGSLSGWQRLNERINKENPDKIILLGDIFYHGIRNSLPQNYRPDLLLKELNPLKGKLFSVIGNCDSEVDISVAEFAFLPHYVLDYGGKSIFLSHGHKYNRNTPPAVKFDACIYGHEHVGYIAKSEGTVFACVGSVSMSKGGAECYMMIDGGLILKDLDGNIIDSCDF